MTDQPVRAGSTLSGLSLRVLARHPDRVAFSWEGGEITYAQTLDLIARFQSVYAAHGLVRGKRLALLAGNRVEAWCAGVAAQANGLSLTPLHPIGSLDDHLYQVGNAEADALVVDVPRHGARGAELAAQAGVGVFFTLGQADYGIDLLAAAQDAGAVTARDLAQADDLAVLNYTGGTTGRPKGVVTRHVAAAARPGAVLGAFEIPDNPIYLAVAPISHVTGQKILPTLFKGGRVHLMNGFSSRGVLDTIARERINMALMVPTMIYGLLDDPDLDTADLSSLELLLYGASPMSPSRLIEGMQRIGPVFSQLYGQSECYPISVLSKADHDPANPERFGSCGVPVPGVDVRLLNEDGSEVAQGEPGEICVRSVHAFEGYWNLPELTAEATQHGWLHTGDVARADPRGYLYIVDRRKDMIVTGGFNVYPREVEDALSAHPAVSQVAVFGVPDAKWGEAVAAAVVLRAGAQVEAEALMQHVRARKGPVQTPKRIDFMDALPATSVGKVDKKQLRAAFWAGRDRMVG